MRQNISIALCTYNGEEFLAEQLRSLVEQTRLPDELVVCDDCSSDQTLTILENFAAACAFPVRIFHNENNLGSTKNFEKAVSLCHGDIIALSDQDDVWLPEKLAEIESVFIRSPNTGMVFSDAEVVDDHLQPLGFSLWSSVGFTPQLQGKFKVDPFRCLLKSYLVTGATLAFREQYRSLVIPFSRYYWIHDGWISLLIAAVAPVVFVDRSLILYRQHQTNQLGAQRDSLKRRLVKARQWGTQDLFDKIKALTCAHARLSRFSSSVSASKTLDSLQPYIRHLLVRRAIIKLGQAGAPRALYELFNGNYHKYSNGWKSFVSDLGRNFCRE